MGKVVAATLGVAGVLAAARYLPDDAPVHSPAAAHHSVGIVAPREKQARARTAEVQRPAELSTKPIHVDLCYFSALSLRVARDRYLTSLGGDEPAADRLPEFLGAAGYSPHSRSGRSGGSAVGVQLVPATEVNPNVSRASPLAHVRSCGIASNAPGPAFPEVDATLATFDQFVKPLARWLEEAEGYYGRKQYEKDQFRRALSLHHALVGSFAKLDAELERFGKALASWTYEEQIQNPQLRDQAAAARSLGFLLLSADAGHVGDARRPLKQTESRPEWNDFVRASEHALQERQPLSPEARGSFSTALVRLLAAIEHDIVTAGAVARRNETTP